MRPIAGSTALFKLAAAYLMEQGRDEAQSFFEKSGIQLGVFVQDGVASAARLTQLMLEANPKDIVLKTDFKKRFQQCTTTPSFGAAVCAASPVSVLSDGPLDLLSTKYAIRTRRPWSEGGYPVA